MALRLRNYYLGEGVGAGLIGGVDARGWVPGTVVGGGDVGVGPVRVRSPKAQNINIANTAATTAAPIT